MIIGDMCDTRGPIKEIPNRTRSSVYREVGDISARSFRKYAKKIGATHHYSTKQVYTEGREGDTVLLFEVLRLIYDPMYDEFDNLLFCDTDIVCNTEDNIFDIHKESGKDISCVLESDIFTNVERTNRSYNSWDYDDKKMQQIIDKYTHNDLPIVPAKDMGSPNDSKMTMMNTGVHVWTKEARLKARETFGDWWKYVQSPGKDFWLNNDQPFISGNVVKHGFTLNHLNQTWNESPPHFGKDQEKTHDLWKDQNFLHYTGGFGKKYLLDAYDMGLFKYV